MSSNLGCCQDNVRKYLAKDCSFKSHKLWLIKGISALILILSVQGRITIDMKSKYRTCFSLFFYSAKHRLKKKCKTIQQKKESANMPQSKTNTTKFPCWWHILTSYFGMQRSQTQTYSIYTIKDFKCWFGKCLYLE